VPLFRDAPNQPLLVELNEVAADALRLFEYLQADNTISDDFPKAQLEAICVSVQGLPRGTASAAREILSYSAKRLASIRREHLHPEEAAPSSLSKDSPPPPLRGMNLDRHLKELMASVGTALDECERQSGHDDRDIEEPRVVQDRDNPTIQEISQKSSGVSHEARDAADVLDEARNPDSTKADELSRNLRDVEALGRIASAELSFPTTVASWIARIAREISDGPANIKRLGKALQVGADLTRLSYLRWGEVWHRLEETVVDEIERLGQDLEDYAQRLEGKRGARGNSDIDSREVRRRVLLEMSKSSEKTQRIEALKTMWSEFGSHPETISALIEGAFPPVGRAIRIFCGVTLASAFRSNKLGDRGVSILSDVYQKATFDVRLRLIRALAEVHTDTIKGEERTRLRDFLFNVFEANADNKLTQLAFEGIVNHFDTEFNIVAQTLQAVRRDQNTGLARQIVTLIRIRPDRQDVRDAALDVAKGSDSQVQSEIIEFLRSNLTDQSWTTELLKQMHRKANALRVRSDAGQVLQARTHSKPFAN
jgi:hypothetical protein